MRAEAHSWRCFPGKRRSCASSHWNYAEISCGCPAKGQRAERRHCSPAERRRHHEPKGMAVLTIFWRRNLGRGSCFSSSSASHERSAAGVPEHGTRSHVSAQFVLTVQLPTPFSESLAKYIGVHSGLKFFKNYSRYRYSKMLNFPSLKIYKIGLILH